MSENFDNVYCVTLSEKNITEATRIQSIISKLYFVDKVSNVVRYKFTDIEVSEIISSNK